MKNHQTTEGAIKLETRCIRVRLKPDTLPAVRDWQDFMKARQDDVAKTLAAEGVVLESVFLDLSPASPCLIYVMRCADFERAARIARASNAEVDVYHRAFKETAWEAVEQLEPLLDISAHEKMEKPL